MPSPRLILFPGLGADHRMFQPQLDALPIQPELAPRLPITNPHESLPAYAQRLAAHLRPRADNERLLLCGSSFGGMLALEVAQHLPCDAVLLVSSCRSRAGLPRAARLLSPLTPYVPTPIARFSKGAVTLARLLFGATTRDQARLFRDMLHDTPPDFLKWSLHRAATWPGIPDTFPIPIHQIHGRRDRVIPCPHPHPSLQIIPHAGHLLPLTHPAEVTQFLLHHLNPPP